jgi:hypothetical protein
MELVELRIFCRKIVFDARLFCKTFYHFQRAFSPNGAESFSK